MKFIGIAVLSLTMAGMLAAQGANKGRRQNGEGSRGRGAAQMDTDRDGKISRDEFKGPAEAFGRFDTDGDGYITREEMTARGGRSNRQGMDANNDGRISSDEWKGPKEAFDRVDANHDGYVTREEMQQMRQNRPQQRGGQRMDTNSDGRISKDEWKGQADAFDRLDTNHDGYLAQDEMPARRSR